MDRAELTDWGAGLDDEAFGQALAALGALAALAPERLATAYAPGSGWVASALARVLAEAVDPETGDLVWQPPLAPDDGRVVPRLHVALPDGGRATPVALPDASLLSAIWSSFEHPSADTPLSTAPRLLIEDRSGLMSAVFWDWLRPWLRVLAGPPEAMSMARPPEPASTPDAVVLPQGTGAEPSPTPATSPPSTFGAALESLPKQPAPAVPRYVHASSRWIDDPGAPCSAYVVGRPVRVEVDIDARRLDSTAAPTPFPEERLPPAAQHELQVLLHEPRQFDQPMLASITLPRTGRSTAAVFDFTPRAEGAFEARLSILHRGRVLQTLLLRTQVLPPDTEGLPGGPGITLDEETRVRDDWSDLDRRRQFDLAMVFNHTPAGEPLATAVAGARAWATSLDAVDAPVRRINGLISAVAQSVADHDGGLDQGENPALLTNLARSGADLYSLLYRDQLQPLASDGLDIGDPSITHIQLISTREDAVVPLEFMYDFNVPNPGAPLCPQHREALERGCCPDGCARAAQPRGYVCPMGFWGLKKVIERHMYDPRAQASLPAGAALAVQVEAVAGRDRLDLSAGALVAHSRQVKSAQVRPLLTRLKKKYRRATPVARDWNDWSRHIQTSRPALLITFPHNEGLRPDQLLEISGDRLFTTGLEPEYVHAADGPAPVVFLLGCDVAGAAQDFSGHIRYFRQAGAAVVISTIATVFGAHAVRVGKAIVAGLLAADAGESVSIGERIRDAKRAALLDSIPMALCVVAFGDADWRL